MLSGINQPQNDTCFVIPSSEAESSRGCRYGAPIRDNAQQQDCVSMAMGSTPPTTHWKATGCGWAGLVVQRGTRPTSIAEPGTSTRNPLPADATGGQQVAATPTADMGDGWNAVDLECACVPPQVTQAQCPASTWHTLQEKAVAASVTHRHGLSPSSASVIVGFGG